MLKGFDDYPVTIGDYLRGERATCGLTIDEAANLLKVSVDILKSIENGAIPEGKHLSIMYGLVKSYARLLNLDENDLVDRYLVEVQDREMNISLDMDEKEVRNKVFKFFLAIFSRQTK